MRCVPFRGNRVLFKQSSQRIDSSARLCRRGPTSGIDATDGATSELSVDSSRSYKPRVFGSSGLLRFGLFVRLELVRQRTSRRHGDPSSSPPSQALHDRRVSTLALPSNGKWPSLDKVTSTIVFKSLKEPDQRVTFPCSTSFFMNKFNAFIVP